MKRGIDEITRMQCAQHGQFNQKHDHKICQERPHGQGFMEITLVQTQSTGNDNDECGFGGYKLQ